MSRDRREIARNEARRLRREGISSLQIAKILNIPKNTVYKWVRDIELTPEQKRIIQKRRTEAAAAVTRKTAAREEARRLRREGLSLKEIQERLGVSQSSVSVWVRDIPLTDEQKAALLQRRPMYYGHLKGSYTNHKKFKAMRQQYQEEGRIKALERDPLHIAGCMLYWAEGEKTRNRISFANSDPDMLVFFCKFLRQCLHVEDDAMTIHIMCYTTNGISQKEIEDFWLQKLELPASCLRKTTVNNKPKSSQQRGRKLLYGVCALSVNRSVGLVQHIYGALQEYIGIDKPEWLL